MSGLTRLEIDGVPFYAASEVEAHIAELEAVVREIEWNGISFNRYGAGFDACPCCGARVQDGHAFGCRLAAALATDTPTAAREAGEGGKGC